MKKITGFIGALAICWAAQAAYAQTETLSLALYKDASNQLNSEVKVISEGGGNYRIRPGKGGGGGCDNDLYCDPGGGGMVGHCDDGKRIALGWFIGNGDPDGLNHADYDASADVSANDFGMCTAHVNTWKNLRFFIRRGGSWSGKDGWGEDSKQVGIYYGKCLNPSCGKDVNGGPIKLRKISLSADLYKVDSKTQTETLVKTVYAEMSLQ